MKKILISEEDFTLLEDFLDTKLTCLQIDQRRATVSGAPAKVHYALKKTNGEFQRLLAAIRKSEEVK